MSGQCTSESPLQLCHEVDQEEDQQWHDPSLLQPKPSNALVPALHSQAEVKFALLNLDHLPRFTELALSTDLRQLSVGSPPRPSRTVPVWSGAGPRWPSYSRQHVPPELVSFNIANMSVDCLDGVDVVADGENIKKLLKLAYSQDAEVSMTVHRVGRLLLLDDYDITQHLLNTEKNEWIWLDRLLREFFRGKFEDVDWARRAAAEEETAVLNSSSAQLFSQLLQLSLKDAGPPSLAPPPAALALTAAPAQQLALTSASDVASEPPPSRAKYRKHYFSRNMLWTFQDLKMLIGTDMPILGGGTHPCVSLRLHDLSERINVLTGLDYWLDNLMSNVPEVLMCYHLNGVLQQYSLVKTEDLPYLPNSSFRPDVVHDVAENILSFLRGNATKTGHTYWLFKGEKDDCVKLYDLTSLLEKRYENITLDDNPFTGHVAILLYRIACNMIKNRHIVDYGDRLGTLRILLNKCLDLMQGDKYLQVRANILLMLTECYVPRQHRPLSTRFDGGATSAGRCDTDDDDDRHTGDSAECDEGTPSAASASVVTAAGSWMQPSAMQLCSLSCKGAFKTSPGNDDSGGGDSSDLHSAPICGDALERTSCALPLVHAALLCVQNWRDLLATSAAPPRPARPHHAIPMPYCRLDDHSVTPPQPADTPTAETDQQPQQQEDEDTSDDGDVTEQLLLQKAAQLCTVRATALSEHGRQPDSLQVALVALRCVDVARGEQHVPEVTAAASLLVADGLLHLSRCPAEQLSTLYRQWLVPDEVQPFVDLLARSEHGDYVISLPGDGEQNADEKKRLLISAQSVLRRSLELQLSPETRQLVTVRLGLLLNELGILYSGQLGELSQKYIAVQPSSCPDSVATQMTKDDTSESVLKQLQDAFEAAEMALNESASLLSGCRECCMVDCNRGRLYDRWAWLHELAILPSSQSVNWLQRAADAFSRAIAACRTTDDDAFCHMMAGSRGLLAARLAAAAVAAGRTQLLRSALTLCDPAQLPEEASCRADVCRSAGGILHLLASQLAEDSKCGSERRRRRLAGECESAFRRAADMYCDAARPDLAVRSMHAALVAREHAIVGCSHWFGRVRALEDSLKLLAAPDSALHRACSCSAADSSCAAAVSVESALLCTSLLNALRAVCALLRRHSDRDRSQMPDYFDQLYRHCLTVSVQRSWSDLDKLQQMLAQIRQTVVKH